MDSLFGQTFISIFGGLLNIFIIAALAAFLTHRKLVTQEVINGLSKLVVMIFLPFLIFYTVTQELDPGIQTYWWTLPLLAILLPSIGLFLSWILFYRHANRKK
ncbi:MAG: AEC family transporter, partial [bacterium]